MQVAVTEEELEYFFLVGGPYDRMLVRRSKAERDDAVVLTIDPHEGHPEPILYTFQDGELRYVEHSM